MAEASSAEFRSRTATLRLIDTPSGPRLRKSGRGWSVADAREVASSHQRWSQALTGIPRVSSPHAEAVADPPAVILDYIEGTDLSELVRSGHDCPEHVRACGMALAAFHAANMRKPEAYNPRQVIKWRRLLLMGSRIERATRPVRTAGDFAPYNIRIDTANQIFILDASTRRRTVTSHRDIAWFLWWYLDYGGAHMGEFISGYAHTCNVDFGGADRKLTWLYLCVMSMTRARRTFQRRHFVRFLRYVVQALGARLRAGC